MTLHHFRSPSGAVASVESPRWHQARREAARELRCSEQDCEPVDRGAAAVARYTGITDTFGRVAAVVLCGAGHVVGAWDTLQSDTPARRPIFKCDANPAVVSISSCAAIEQISPAAAPGPPQDAPAAEAGRVGRAKRSKGNVGAKV